MKGQMIRLASGSILALALAACGSDKEIVLATGSCVIGQGKLSYCVEYVQQPENVVAEARGKCQGTFADSSCVRDGAKASCLYTDPKGSGVSSTVIWYDASQIKGQEAFCSDGGGQFSAL